jgi:hypothetical protein
MTMIQGMRFWFAVAALATAGLQAGCDKAKTLACTESIAQACSGTAGCALTWNEAQGDTAFCAGAMPLRIECGDYHAVTFAFAETSRTYYYTIASGMLVAIVDAFASSPDTVCAAGPSGGFTPPVCAGAGSEPLPQCLDGGTAD